MHEIKHKLGEGFFIYGNNSEILAQLTYVERDNKILVFEHTIVEDVLQGQGIAGKLLDEGVKYARENGYLIQPVCSYVVSKFRDSKYDDVNYNIK